MAWTEAKFDRSTRENYETLHFVTAIGEVEGKTLFVSGRCVGRVTYSNIPCDAQLYHEVHGALKEDHGGGFFTSQTTQVIVAFRRGDEHMQQSPQGDLFSAPPEPLAERYELGACVAERFWAPSDTICSGKERSDTAIYGSQFFYRAGS